MLITDLSLVINEQLDSIKNIKINDREYEFEENGNYVIVGLRRAGKSTLLYKRIQDLISKGIKKDQIIYINFEDERLKTFTSDDFDKLFLIKEKYEKQDIYLFLDEVQLIPYWEKFARRMADYKVKTYITGSNATMLSSQIETTLGGRYLTQFVQPYNFRELLNSRNIMYNNPLAFTLKDKAQIMKLLDEYLHFGGFPENKLYQNKRNYIDSVYKKILLGDIASRNKIRNVNTLRLIIGKIAESVKDELSYAKLANNLKTIGIKIDRTTLVDYISYAIQSYLIFPVYNYMGKYAEREGYPKYYFGDNGLLNLHLINKDALLLENLVATELLRNYHDDIYFLKSKNREYDIDFYVPSMQWAIQVAYSVNESSYYRETSNLVKLSKYNSEVKRFSIITYDEEQTLEIEGTTIDVIPVWKWMLNI